MKQKNKFGYNYLLVRLICIASILGVCSCATTNNKVNGESAYEQKKYADAIELLTEEYKEESNPRQASRIAYFAAASYENLNDISHAIRWYEKAVRGDYGEVAERGLARSYKQNGDYAGALEIWNDLQRKHPSDNQIKREIQTLKLASEWAAERQSSTKVYALENSSNSNEYSVTIYEGNYLVYSADTKNATGSDNYGWTGNKYSDLFISDKEGRGVRRFDAEINTNENEGAACFNQDFSKIIFTRCISSEGLDTYCKLMYSNKIDGLWTSPEVINFVADGVNYGQPTLIENDSVMIFCSKGIEGTGGYDLYYSQYLGDDEWSAPYLMPSSINTPGDEYFPTAYGDTLFFSSDYHPGLGGLDIFKTYLKSDGSWARPENLRQPINSSFDDFGFVVDEYAQLRGKEIQRGYFCTSRAKGGNDNIYSYVKYQPSEPIPEDTTPDKEENEISIYLAGKVISDQYEDENDPNSPIIGIENISNAQVLISGDMTVDRRSGQDGLFIEELQQESSYTIKASKPGYLSKKVSISTKNLNLPKDENSYTINIDVKLDKIFYDQEIILKEIYYEYDKWDIIDAAKPTLDRLAIILKDNPQIRIQLNSHTDCRGEDDYNAQLSQKRAQSAVLYLVDRGINFDRLQAQGYGESQLAIDCICESCTEEQHQTNRRTTFKVLR